MCFTGLRARFSRRLRSLAWGTTRRLSFRLEGPAAGADNLFSWNSGADGAGPILTVNYSMPAAGKRPNKQ